MPRQHSSQYASHPVRNTWCIMVGFAVLCTMAELQCYHTCVYLVKIRIDYLRVLCVSVFEPTIEDGIHRKRGQLTFQSNVTFPQLERAKMQMIRQHCDTPIHHTSLHMSAYMKRERDKGTHNKDMCPKRMLSKPTTYRISMNRHPETTFACIAQIEQPT